MAPISILVIEDHPFLRFGLTVAFSTEDHFKIVDELSDIGGTRRWLEDGGRADIAILDRGLPDGDGLTLVPLLKAAGMKVIILTIEDGGREIREAIDSNVDGYLLKSADSDEVVQAMYIALQDAKAFPFHVLQRLSKTARANTLDALSSREMEVAEMVTLGLSNKTIGRQLDLTDNTIRNHLANIMSKLGLQNRVQLAMLVLQAQKSRRSLLP
jgi:DNA-binding NarL/FixJ family response regulator